MVKREASPRRSVCIHGHFYQPPRENPWTEEIELQESAAPYHDWNERVNAECYAPNTASRILDKEQKAVGIANNFLMISFNVGPTLFAWMERKAPGTYRRILEADRASRERFAGNGPALAQCYNHMIMPLAKSRDKRTQVVWGIRDFKHRFGRPPEGMWLPETAVDLETLDLFAEFGIRFTILAQRQARRARPFGAGEWTDVRGGKIDSKKPYLCRLPSGKSIAIFFFDDIIAREVAFGSLLDSGEALAGRLLSAFFDGKGEQLVSIATDGETFGHHHPRGDQALASSLYSIERQDAVRITNYAEYLSLVPPRHEVEVLENSSWSCVHGVERWRSDCGCNSGRQPGWKQHWRAPLREALDWLRDALAPAFEEGMGNLVLDPWQARDDYIDIILDRAPESVSRFLSRLARRGLSPEEKITALKWLETQRQALLMYTSCGWFFDDITGLETTQVIKYGARAVQLAQETAGIELESGFRDRLALVPSNVPEISNARFLYDRLIKPAGMNKR